VRAWGGAAFQDGTLLVTDERVFVYIGGLDKSYFESSVEFEISEILGIGRRSRGPGRQIYLHLKNSVLALELLKNRALIDQALSAEVYEYFKSKDVPTIEDTKWIVRETPTFVPIFVY
jgi:hypothetical protein